MTVYLEGERVCMTVYLEGEGVCMTVDPAEETLGDAEDSCRTIAGEEPAVAFVPEARKSCMTGGKSKGGHLMIFWGRSNLTS